MELILSHQSALECLRLFPARRHRGITRTRSDAHVSGASSAAIMRHLCRSGCGSVSTPVHLFATSAEARCRCLGTRWHVHETPLPRESFWRAGEGTLSPCPELCFVQLAETLPFPRLLEVGFELCGGYAKRPDAPGGFIKRPSVSTISLMKSFLSSCGPLRGKEQAARAARYLAEGSASPMETAAYLLLCLPERYGGHGLPRARMNCRIDIDKRKRATTSKGHYRCDLLWPQTGLAVEYDSDLCHTGSDRIAADAHRRVELAYLGIETITMTRQQIFNRAKTERLANTVAKKLGVRKRKRADWTREQTTLRAHLLDFSSTYDPASTVRHAAETGGHAPDEPIFGHETAFWHENGQP